MPFKKGQGGRAKGTRNKNTVDVQAVCRAMVDDLVYRKKLKVRLLAGELPPAVETMLWHYAHGKPKETVEHSGEIQMPAQVIFELHRS